MLIDYLKEFVVLAQIGNFQRAAEELYLSQPTLTRHIKLLESELSVCLLNRTTRKTELSEYGEYLLPYAKEIVRLEEEYTIGIISRLKDAEKALTVGSIPSMTPYRITDLLADFNRQNPSCNINVLEEHTAVLIQYLKEGVCDFAFLRSDNSINELHKVVIAHDKMVAILPTNHPLAQEKSITFEQLKNDNLLLLKGDLLYRKLINDYDNAEDRPKISFTGTRVENIIDLVSKGVGVSIILRSSMSSILNNSVSAVNIVPDLVMDISLAYIKSRKMNLVSSLFLEFVKQWAPKNT